MNDLYTSLVRTYVPIIVGSVAGFLAARGVTLDPTALAGLTAFLSGLFAAVYYFLARKLERKYPVVGKYLLGSARKPNYEGVK